MHVDSYGAPFRARLRKVPEDESESAPRALRLTVQLKERGEPEPGRRVSALSHGGEPPFDVGLGRRNRGAQFRSSGLQTQRPLRVWPHDLLQGRAAVAVGGSAHPVDRSADLVVNIGHVLVVESLHGVQVWGFARGMGGS